MKATDQASHREYLEVLRRLTPQEKVRIAFDLSARAKARFFARVKHWCPTATDEVLMQAYRRFLE